MANSLLTSLLGMLDKRSVGGIAGALGESEQSVSRGMQSSIAAVLGGLASKAEDPGTLRTMLDLAPNASGGSTLSQLASGFSDANSPLISGGKRVLSGLFGTSESAVTSAISRDSGLRSGVTSTLMAVAAPIVMSFLGKRVRDEGMSMSGLGNLLQQESGTIRSALPAGLSDLFWPRASVAATASPVVAQAVERERSSFSWLPILALVLLAPFLFWLFSHTRKPTITQQITPAPIAPDPTAPAPTGTANRVAPDLGDIVKPKLPENVDLRFDTGSTKLRPESQEQLNQIAADLRADPDVRAKVAGYTDNVGGAGRNLELSQKRANSVTAELVRKGISPDRLTAEGYGQQDPIADNSTAEGRALNRRVSVGVTQK
jgi:outer membrane protein OmpA-like peptidoglycan-associated protein